jgi:GNAT superfamily N-acetyltransferase
VLEDDNKIIGNLSAIPVKTTDNSLCVSFFTVASKYRGKGYAKILMESLRRLAKSKGYNSAYYLVTRPKGLRIHTWYRPIKLDKCSLAGYQYKSYRGAKDRNNYRDKLQYSIRPVPEIERLTDGAGYHDYLELASGYSLSFRPDETAWKKWLQIKTYRVKSKNGVSIFSLADFKQKVGAMSLDISILILAVGFCPDILKGALSVSIDKDLLYGYLVGPIEESQLAAVNAFKTRLELYFCTDGLACPLDASQIAVPML